MIASLILAKFASVMSTCSEARDVLRINDDAKNTASESSRMMAIGNSEKPRCRQRDCLMTARSKVSTLNDRNDRWSNDKIVKA